MKKTVFRNFRYIQCDDFAAYLQEMSAKGWHFREWRIGLVFEKGEPERISYAVEVFPKGSELDTYVGQDAEEFAEYCRAAGWELLDGKQKFCIFRQMRPDALPICEPSERLQNVIQAEQKQLLPQLLCYVLLALLYWLQFLTLSFSQWIFNNVMLLILAIFTLFTVASFIKGGLLFMKKRQFSSLIKAGEVPSYTSSPFLKTLKNLSPLLYFLLSLAYLSIVWLSGQRAAAITAGILFLLILIVTLLISWFRPSREGNRISQITLGLTVPLLVLVIVTAQITSDRSAASPVPSEAAVLSLPEESFGTYALTDFNSSKSIMGSMESYTVDYHHNTMQSDFIYCRSYRSSHPWVLDRIWKDETKYENALASDCSAQWDAVKGYRSQGGTCYYLYYPDQVIVLMTGKDLTGAQVKALKQAYCPYQTSLN